MTVIVRALPVWATADGVRSLVAEGMPRNWLWRFATSEKHRGDVRKLGAARNSTLLYRCSAIIEALESGELPEDETPPGGGIGTSETETKQARYPRGGEGCECNAETMV